MSFVSACVSNANARGMERVLEKLKISSLRVFN